MFTTSYSKMSNAFSVIRFIATTCIDQLEHIRKHLSTKCSSWSMFHQQLILLRGIFQKNGYPENFIDRCFKLFLNRIHILKEKDRTVEKKPPSLVILNRKIAKPGINFCKAIFGTKKSRI